MAEGYGTKCVKYMLFVLNIIFWLVGAALLGVGLWLRLDKSILKYVEVLSFNQNDPMLNVAAYIIIGTGGFIFIIGFSGCCGAVIESRFLLYIYAVFIIILIAIQMLAGVLAMLFANKVESNLELYMKSQVKQDYMTNNTVGMAWHFLMTDFECCGATGPSDWVESKWKNTDEAKAENLTVPVQCCKTRDEGRDPLNPQYLGLTQCQLEAANNSSNKDKYLNTVGCVQQLTNWVKSHGMMLLIIAGCVAIFEIFVVLVACCLAYKIKQEKVVYA